MSRLVLAQPNLLPMPQGYQFTIGATSTTTNGTLAVGNFRCHSWQVTQPVTLTRIGAEVTAVGDAGSKVRLGIYADNGAGYPGALLVDAGTIAGDSATVQEIAINLKLTPGVYWVGAVIQNVTTTQPTLTCPTSSGAVPPVTSTTTTIPTVGSARLGYVATSVTGALPTAFPPGSSNAGAVPRTFVKVGA